MSIDTAKRSLVRILPARMRQEEDKTRPGKTSSWRHRRALAALLIGLSALALLQPLPQLPKMFGDSPTYIKWMPIRLPGYCLFVAMAGHGAFLCVAQTAVSVAAWCFLGWAVAGVAGVAICALLAASSPVAQWNLYALSESLSLSLIAASLAATIQLLRRWSPARFAAWGLLIAAMALTRIANLYLLPFLPLPFLFRAWRQFVLAGIVAGAVYVTGAFLCGTRGVMYQRVALTDVIMFRILPDPDATAFFRERGMPCGPEVMKYAGRVRNRYRSALWADSPEFADWVAPHGVKVYQRWLLGRFASFREAASALADFRNRLPWYQKGTQLCDVSIRLLPFYCYTGVAPLWVWLAGLTLPAVAWRLTGRPSALSLMASTLVLATYAQAFVCWHGECDEMPRLMLPSGILYRITLGVGLTACVEIFGQFRRDRAATCGLSRPP